MTASASKLTKFRRLSAADKWLLLRAIIWLGVARLMLGVMSFNRLSQKLAVDPAETGVEPDTEYLGRVSYAVGAAANSVPWRSDCFPRTIAARMLLRRAGHASIIHFGVEKASAGSIAGHAWLTCGDTVVTGGGNLDRYTEMHRINA